jgi:hypothetical protein
VQKRPLTSTNSGQGPLSSVPLGLTGTGEDSLVTANARQSSVVIIEPAQDLSGGSNDHCLGVPRLALVDHVPGGDLLVPDVTIDRRRPSM